MRYDPLAPFPQVGSSRCDDLPKPKRARQPKPAPAANLKPQTSNLKPSAIAEAMARVPDATLSLLAPDRDPAQLRAAMLAWCAAHPAVTDWRLAFAAVNLPAAPIPLPVSLPNFKPETSNQKPFPAPAWRQRMARLTL